MTDPDGMEERMSQVKITLNKLKELMLSMSSLIDTTTYLMVQYSPSNPIETPMEQPVTNQPPMLIDKSGHCHQFGHSTLDITILQTRLMRNLIRQ